MRQAKGFSLIEIMIVLAIVGILLAISYPDYKQRVLISYRTEATSALLLLANSLEQHRADYGRYTDSFKLLGHNILSKSGRYKFSIVLTDGGNAFRLDATAISQQTADSGCLRFSLNHVGQRNPGDPASIHCWN